MIETLNLVLPPEIAFQEEELKKYLAKKHGVNESNSFKIKRRSIDARQKNVKINLTIDVSDTDIEFGLDSIKTHYSNVSDKTPLIIVGAGPAGLFAALECLENDIKPIILERGKDVRSRRRDLATIIKSHIVNPDSNYCFGEGGAGTYSDGKLYTRSKKKGDLKKVLQILVEHGASENILVDAHPHIGTNKLPNIIQAIRETILQNGGEILFESKVVDLLVDENRITGVQLQDGRDVKAKGVVLATGHSARDIFKLLASKNIQIFAKPFALGVRVEHPQSFINSRQYKDYSMDFLPSASYKLVSQERSQETNKGVFSFCMCPGGFIVPAATKQNEIVVNGMSPSRRNSKFANSGIVVEVNDRDWKQFAHFGPLAGMYYQESIEKKACELAGNSQKAPAQRLKDFINDIKSNDLPDTSYKPGLVSVELKEVLPETVVKILRAGFQSFNKKIHGFVSNEAVIVGVESRTSSPVSIPRDKDSLQHPEIIGLFPCGEGAGYAGGIVSAAIDGQRCAKGFASFVFNVIN